MNAILFTAWARPQILERTLASWDKVRGIQDWAWSFRIDPSVQTDAVREVIKAFIARNELSVFEINVNPRHLGVLRNPWVGFEELFKDFPFVLRAEDDLCVSDDILDYFTWAELTYREHPNVATIHGYTDDVLRNHPHLVDVRSAFNPWIWGTWRHWWKEIIGPTWDHDYSTFNGTPGNQSGWDWNLDTRIFPQHELCGVYPRMSRVDNIGVHGVHGTPANWRTAPTFRPVYGVVDYRES